MLIDDCLIFLGEAEDEKEVASDEVSRKRATYKIVMALDIRKQFSVLLFRLVLMHEEIGETNKVILLMPSSSF